MTEESLVYPTPNCTPFFNKVVQPAFRSCSRSPHSTIQKNIKKFGRFKKNIFLCSVTNIKNMKVKSFRYNGKFYCVKFFSNDYVRI